MELIPIALCLPVAATWFWLKMRHCRWDRRMLWSLAGGALLGVVMTFPGLCRPLPVPTTLPWSVISLALTAMSSMALAPSIWLCLDQLHRRRARKLAALHRSQHNNEADTGTPAADDDAAETPRR